MRGLLLLLVAVVASGSANAVVAPLPPAFSASVVASGGSACVVVGDAANCAGLPYDGQVAQASCFYEAVNGLSFGCDASGPPYPVPVPDLIPPTCLAFVCID